MWRLCPIVCVISGCLFGPGPDDDIPETDSCSAPVTAGFDSLEVGFGGDGAFAPMTEGAVVELVVGGQGADMLLVRYRVEGPTLPDCTSHESVLLGSDGFGELARSSLPLRLYEEGAGAATRTVFLILFGPRPPAGLPMQLRVTAGETSLRRNIWLEAIGADAGPPPGTFGDPCSQTAPCTSGFSCIDNLCTVSCNGLGDTSCPGETTCREHNEGGEFLGFFCKPAS